MKYILVATLLFIGTALGLGLSTILSTTIRVYSFNESLMLDDQSSMLINEQLNLLIKTLPDVATIRVGVIHGHGVINKTNYKRFRFDVINLRSAAGVDSGPISVNESLDQWGDVAVFFLDNKCVSNLVVDLTSEAAKSKMNSFKATSFIGCPIKNHRGDLLGGIFAVYDSPHSPKQDSGVEKKLQDAASKIYDAVEIRINRLDRL